MPNLPPEIEKHYFRARAVLEEVSRLQAAAVYPSAAAELLSVIYASLEIVEKEFEDLTGNSEAEGRAARRYGQVASSLHDCLQFLEGSDEEHAPSSLVEPLETLAQKHMRGCKLLVRGSTAGGLDAWWCELFIPGLRQVLQELPRRGQELAGRLTGFVSLVFPAAERQNILMHALLGHELGHGFSDDLNIGAGIAVPVPAAAEEHLEKLTEPIRSGFEEVVVQWLEEMLADALGVHIMGPAYYFACNEAVGQSPASDSHPSGAFRLQALRHQLRLRGYVTGDSETAKWLGKFITSGAAGEVAALPPTGEEEPLLRAAELCLRQVRGKVLEAAQSHKPEEAFMPDRFVWVASELPERLCHLVPPDEADGEQAGLADILNAGWLVRLRRWDKFCESLGAGSESASRYQATLKLNALLLKALEYSAIRTHWEAEQ